MDLLLVADPLETLKLRKDSTVTVLRDGWKVPLLPCVAAAMLVPAVDPMFVASNRLKLMAAWFPLVIGGVISPRC